MKREFAWVVILVFAWLVGSCAPERVPPISEEDNPAHHYLVGMELIDRERLGEATKRFERAVQLEPNYAPALSGLSLVGALKTEAEEDREHKSIELKRALDYFQKAWDEAEGASQKFAVLVTGIRVYTHSGSEGWMEKAEDFYEDALGIRDIQLEELPYYRSLESAHYFMGLACFYAYRFRDTEDILAKVLSAVPGRWHEPANQLFKRAQKITRASTHFTLTDVAKRIAVKDEVVRVDVAALLVDEIRLDRFFAGRIPVRKAQPKASFVPADVVNHLFKSEIMTVVKWKLRGLEPLYDQTSKAYLFYPDRPITRKELAFTLEDLVIRITGDESLATKYFGQPRSPYPDVPAGSPWFNAVMNAVSRGLMEPELSGEFRPDDYADGAELLLAVMRLRNVMNLH